MRFNSITKSNVIKQGESLVIKAPNLAVLAIVPISIVFPILILLGYLEIGWELF